MAHSAFLCVKGNVSCFFWIYLDRVAGGDRNYSDFGGDAVARIGQSEAKGRAGKLFEQSEAVNIRLGHVCRRQQQHSAAECFNFHGKFAKLGGGSFKVGFWISMATKL